MVRRAQAVFLAVLLCFCLLPPTTDAVRISDARNTKSNGKPYYIMVNRRMSTVTVYGLDENGYYTVPVRAMLCSTGSTRHMTPKGDCAIGVKHRWHQMMGGVYAQYLSQFNGACLFHSVCYARPSSDTLLPGYYDALGSPASHGCVRLQTEDAKWIYENCDAGTLVTIYDADDPGELGKPEKMVPSPGATDDYRWDPTDPLPENPWAASWTTDFTLSEETVYLTPGETASLRLARQPEGSTYPTAMFLSDSPAVALADGAGRIRAVGAGRCTVAVRCGGVEKRCTVVVSGTPAGAWYYEDLEFLRERGLITDGCAFYAFPEQPLTFSEAMELLASLFKTVNTGASADAALSRGEFIELLHLYSHMREETPSVRETAMQWAVRVGLLLGDGDGDLAADEPITRAQAAAILHRYCTIFEA